MCSVKYTLEAFAFLAFFFSLVSIPLEMLLYVVEHYKNTSTPAAEMNGDHMATHALTEKKDEERISKDDPDSEISAAPTAEQAHIDKETV